MWDPARIYAYDIETLNDAERGFNGLDPSRSLITEIAVATDASINGGGEVFSGPEKKVLTDFARFVGSLKPGLMSGWNNTFFDNPFLSYRAFQAGLDIGMTLVAQPGLRPKYDPLPTASTPENPNGAWSAFFVADGGQHASLDVASAFKPFAERAGVKWGLKPVCEAKGFPMISLDRENLHRYSEQERRAYNLSDGHGTRFLTLDLLGLLDKGAEGSA